mmetsp:Transcript_71605/g.232820  ORF Transcript_71605/g.232820 Transcript_71605/m.232820 type:complete len:461 (+) Transcript_71605:261-1643(+)
MFFRHRRRFENSHAGEESESEVLEAQEGAAISIQRIWRGNQDRGKTEKIRIRKRPFGYFTHSLGLTYLSVSPLDAHKLAKPSLRSRLFMLLEDPSSSQAAQAISILIITTIAFSVLGFVLETEPAIAEAIPEVLQVLEVLCTIIFSLEYSTRLAVCDQGGISARQFIFAPMNVLDLLAILPFYVELLLRKAGFQDTPVLRAFRVVRLIRVVRVLKLGRYASGIRLTAQALAASSQALSVLVFLLSMGAVLFSSALFYAERLSCPDRDDMTQGDLYAYAQECADSYNHGVSPRFGLCCTEFNAPNDFPSITAATWWTMVTMTSVGYGEVHPRTVLGKCVGSLVMLTGMVVIALPVAIVGQNFQELYECHNMDMARAAANSRMQAPGRTWALVPGSDILRKLGQLRPTDPDVKDALASFLSALPEVWEQREQLMRERRYGLQKQNDSTQRFSNLLQTMEAAR